MKHFKFYTATPIGISPNHARHIILLQPQMPSRSICTFEGATKLSDGRTDTSTGKLISYLVSDFVKAMNFE